MRSWEDVAYIPADSIPADSIIPEHKVFSQISVVPVNKFFSL
jgi:hypothetical protein